MGLVHVALAVLFQLSFCTRMEREWGMRIFVQVSTTFPALQLEPMGGNVTGL